ncbi:Hydrogen peroxidase [Caenispirillum salinarum AK4]|uniref:Hydrogen peroxidase n=1 Tax=Caenispirillum salinarum AK4 TaxID=1238182 RepID=K9GRA3_9PROT|nr:LysR substrate-binding domain-containing protein [Caenispirillum salinarum]EKV27254.1 Hydrogen peroxidase [Caenispirillum salinarum AK4]
MRHLNYHHLRYFWAIAHAGSLTQVAERMNVSQSALSVQLRKLEEQLGHPLFQREGRTLVLTEAGRIALDYADTIFSAGEDLVATLEGRGTQQVLRVGAITTLSRNFQLEFLRPLMGRRDVELVVRSGSMRDLMTQLEAHAVDMVLSNAPVAGDAQAPVKCHLLREQPVSLVGPDRPERTGFRFPEGLAEQPVLLPSLDSGLRTAFDQRMDLAGIHPVILAEVDDMAMLRLLARETDGLTLVPPVVVRDELAGGALVEWCRIPDIAERFYAVTRTRRFPNPLVRELLEGGTPP